MGRPKNVVSSEIFVHVLYPPYVVTNKRAFEIPLREFHACEQIFREFLIDAAAVTPSICPISIIKKLIEAGNLSRLKGLVRN